MCAGCRHTQPFGVVFPWARVTRGSTVFVLRGNVVVSLETESIERQSRRVVVLYQSDH